MTTPTTTPTPISIKHFVLTGGPCGGKTSALAHLKQELEELGYIVLTVPEAATLCITAGINPGQPFVSIGTLQRAILGLTLDFERQIEKATQAFQFSDTGTAKGIVVLHDRGVADGGAYTTKEVYDALLAQHGLDCVSVWARYDAVLHLVSAADGAEAFYTLANNEARHETAEEARALDVRTQHAWVGHQHFRVIGNETDFGGKLRRVMEEVCVVLGEPVPVERERKFLVRFDSDRIPDSAQHISIEQRYLLTPAGVGEKRVRKRGQGESFTYYLTEKTDRGPGERLEIERIISEREYGFGASMMHPDTKPVVKNRICFVHAKQYLELDVFDDPRALPDDADGMLEIEVTEIGQDILIPDWITVIEEVTDNPDFRNSAIARRVA